jgi:Ca2+:H+ antiporter
MARKNKVDLSIGIALGSSIQIALFVAPMLVLASYFIAPAPLNLAFGGAEVLALFLGVLLGAIVCGDGQSNWYKGVQVIRHFRSWRDDLIHPDRQNSTTAL